MADFVADLRDLKFVLFEQLDLAPLQASERYAGFARDDYEMILDEAYRMSREVLGPANAKGDKEGCSFADGRVTVPPSYREPFKRYIEGGWLSLNRNPAYGGQGAPELLRLAVDDMFFGACIALNLGMLLTPAAAHVIENFGTEESKRLYLRNLFSGKWSGTMCLTEPQAGSDVGAASTRAKKEGDHYLIQGEKIFITFGEHDLTENIVHLVLARIEGAPKGTKGLSLFIVPKFRLNADGTPGAPNDVHCTGIEHKMGIHGSPTCSMSFGPNGGCWGWLLGEEHSGMRLMFQMMNEARNAVGLQGAAIGNAAYQAALQYARERMQGPDLRQMKDPDAPRVPIVRHPDVQVNLARQKAYGEGLRSLMLYTVYLFDRSKIATDPTEKARLQSTVEILVPICKSYGSDMGFRLTEWALQTFGGYGYLHDYPAEQYMRDCKIASLYEGTNGIQALDLVGRKLSMNGGANVMALMGVLAQFIERRGNHAGVKEQVAQVAKARDAWGEINALFASAASSGQFMLPLRTASQYLGLCGQLVLGYLLTDQAAVAWDKLKAIADAAGVELGDAKAVRALVERDPEARYYDAKVKTARFFCAHELPQVYATAAAIKSGDASASEMVWE